MREDFGRGGLVEPGVASDLLVELTWAPPRIAREDHQSLFFGPSGGHLGEGLGLVAQCQVIEDVSCGGLGMKMEEAEGGGLDWSAMKNVESSKMRGQFEGEDVLQPAF